jgi:hypothetical protein
MSGAAQSVFQVVSFFLQEITIKKRLKKTKYFNISLLKDYTRSTTVAYPWPTPIHIVTKAYLFPVR